MESETARDKEPAIELLDPAPTDTVLDVGAGHGRSLGLRRAHRGAVIDVDPSAVMVRRARQRNKTAIAAGRVRVEQAASPRVGEAGIAPAPPGERRREPTAVVGRHDQMDGDWASGNRPSGRRQSADRIG